MRASSGHNRTGFTLVELLVVIAIIGILAALVFAVLSGAKQRTKSVICLSNLHQHGIGLNQFLSDFHVYPLRENGSYHRGDYQEHYSYWEGALFGQFGVVCKTNGEMTGVYRCPSAPSTPRGFSMHDLFYSYGYNSEGLDGHSMHSPLGLGGIGTIDVSALPVPEGAVVKPSEMLAVGDGLLGWNARIHDGWSNLERDVRAVHFEDTTQRANGRHSSKGNTHFCDGHAEGLRLQRLFSDTDDAALKLWNRDNQPHKERLVP